MKIYKKLNQLMRSNLFYNMSWLFILNFSNTLIPYFTFPYITRIFLPEGYGRISFALSFIAYFQTIIDYGFNLTGARLVAKNDNSKSSISKIYSSIVLTKLLFFLLVVPVILVIVNTNDALRTDRWLIYILLIMLLSNVLMPTWLFQGLQRMKFMTVISMSIRFIFLISVFVLIKSPDDIYLYTILYATSFLLISIISIFVIRFRLGIGFSKVSLYDIRIMINDGYYVFTSSAVIRVMGSTGTFVLGLFHSPIYTGYYSGANKIVQVITMMFYPIGQAMFPYICKNYDISFEKGYRVTIKFAKIVIPLFILPTFFLLIFRGQVVSIILGESYSVAANILILISLTPILSIISNLMGTQILVASGKTKEYSRAFFRGSILSIILYIVLGYYFSVWGVSIASVLGSIINIIFLYVEIYKIKKYRQIKVI
ncbi:oligosaccharide flippase family protein [Proteiniclasticum ruminis]|uniref:oligosaccharide flippase family protein n=1 Tax=Proteiniclasticum ruminis TaxID=398199 RepID=UPI0028A58EF5|nr:oligosaccharide flippase family protein [Proteiniclasticum ruminis]